MSLKEKLEKHKEFGVCSDDVLEDIKKQILCFREDLDVKIKTTNIETSIHFEQIKAVYDDQFGKYVNK